MTKFIAVASGKGGTGKTTTAINLGVALKNLGLEVLVVDGNLTQPNISLYLGFPQDLHGFTEVLQGKKRILDTVYLHPSGVGLVPANGSLRLTGNFSEEVGKAMLDLVGRADIVLMDVGAGLGSEVQSILKSADQTIVVANPDHASINDARMTAELAEELGSVVAGIVLNKVTGHKTDIPLSQIRHMTGKHIISIIPEDQNVKKSVLMRNAVVCTHPDSPASVEFKKLAQILQNE